MRLSTLSFLASAVILSAYACRLDLAGGSYDLLGGDTLDSIRGTIPGTHRVQDDPCAWQTIQGDQVTKKMCEIYQGMYLETPCVNCGDQDVQHQGGSGIQFVAEPSCNAFQRYVGVCRRFAPDYEYHCFDQQIDMNNQWCSGLYSTYMNEF